jgi:hypothetical protein
MSWWEFRTELFPELVEDERWTSQYPLPALRAFLSVDLDERSTEECYVPGKIDREKRESERYAEHDTEKTVQRRI